MIYIKTTEEIELIRESSMLVAKTLAWVAKLVQPGITTSELDKNAEEFIKDMGGIPAFKGYRGFPAAICTSVNDQVVHGIPGNYPLKEGDILSVDCGVFMNGFYGDSAYTFAVGEVDSATLKLMQTTKEALYKGIEMAAPGNRVGDIGFAIQNHATSNGFSVVRELVGHGVGKDLHEKPEVPNYGKRGTGAKLSEGMVIAIEPMINAGKSAVRTLRDGWTVRTADGSLSAHYEHTVAIGKEAPYILSSFSLVEEALKKNERLMTTYT